LSSQNKSAQQVEFSPEKIENIAELIVRGESPIPWDLPSDVLESVLQAVHAARRTRLITFFARAVAEHIQTENHTEKEF